MLKATLTALAAAAILAPAALAEGKNLVTLTHSYDAELLVSDAGASELLTDLKRAADRACTSRTPATGGYYLDKDCAESLYVAAVKQIHEVGSEAGVAFAPTFEQAAMIQLASAD